MITIHWSLLAILIAVFILVGFIIFLTQYSNISSKIIEVFSESIPEFVTDFILDNISDNLKDFNKLEYEISIIFMNEYFINKLHERFDDTYLISSDIAENEISIKLILTKNESNTTKPS